MWTEKLPRYLHLNQAEASVDAPVDSKVHESCFSLGNSEGEHQDALQCVLALLIANKLNTSGSEQQAEPSLCRSELRRERPAPRNDVPLPLPRKNKC